MADSYDKSFPVSWEELHRTSKALAWRLLELGPFEGIVAVTRGGLVPAAIVARELEIRLIETACISSYHGSEQGSLDVLKEAPSAGNGKGWLIVDDLVDTGETAKALRQRTALEGVVEVTRADEDGEVHLLAEVGAGAVFGERALLKAEMRYATVRTRTDVMANAGEIYA